MNDRRNRRTVFPLFVGVMALGMLSAGCEKRPQTPANVANAAVTVPAGDWMDIKAKTRKGGQTALAVKPGAEDSKPLVRQRRIRKAAPCGPLTTDELVAGRIAIAEAEDFGDRIKKRRALIYRMANDGEVEKAIHEFSDLLGDVAAVRGLMMAQRAAHSDAGTFFDRRQFEIALAAYELIENEYTDGPLLADAVFQQGNCLLESHEYARAAEVFKRVISDHPNAESAGRAYRNLALVQLLQGEFDASLATLDAMAKANARTSLAEYAQMRRGYVLSAAGRAKDALAAYESFLTAHPESRYVRLVRRQLADLKLEMQVAQR